MSNKESATLVMIVGLLVLLSVPLILGFTFFAANKEHRRKVAEWREIPTLDEYLAQHPDCRTDAGPACSQCHGTSTYNRGLSGVTSKQRIQVCNGCNAQLFRTES